jgi:hypothetical protein
MIDTVVEVGGGYYTRAKILTRLNVEQNKVLGSDCAFMSRVIELQSVAGQLSYALPLVGTELIRSVSGVYSPVPLAVNCEIVPESVALTVGSDGSSYRYKVNGVTFVAADPVTGGGTLNFASDPLGGLFFLRVYVWPAQLLLEADLLTIPDEYTGLLEISITQRLYDRGYGNSDNLIKRLASEKKAWSIFLSTQSSTHMGRPAWGWSTNSRFSRTR